MAQSETEHQTAKTQRHTILDQPTTEGYKTKGARREDYRKIIQKD